MKFYVDSKTSPAQARGEVVVVFSFESDLEGAAPSADANPSLAAINTLLSGRLVAQARQEDFTGKVGETMLVYSEGALSCPWTLVVGAGKAERFSAVQFKAALVKAFRRIRDKRMTEVTVDASVPAAAGIEGSSIGQLIGTYSGMIDYVALNYKTGRRGYRERQRISTLRVINTGAADSWQPVKAGLIAGRAIAESVNYTRDLVTTPAGDLTPFKLMDAAKEVAQKSGGLITGRYYWGRRLETMGANALLAVSRGSMERPVLIELDYTPPSGPTATRLCLVGKSVTFDSGGLDLKPAAGMRDMKRDMSGGATVLGAIRAIAALKLPVSVKVVMAATENMPGNRAFKPGDVIKSMSGVTVEVDNTDAEGRLTLIDAIEFAKRSGVTHIVDFATLTGAVKSIGGDVGAACFGNDGQFTRKVVDAGASQDELMVELPMWEELRSFNDSDIADVKNSGGALAGSTTAAWFIREVAGEEIPWVHVDIAGVAFRTRELGPDPKGASGYGVRTAVALAALLGGGC